LVDFLNRSGRLRRFSAHLAQTSLFNWIEDGASVVLHPTNQINDGSLVERR